MTVRLGSRNPLVVVTGGHDAGKSFFCMRVVRAAQRRGMSVGGVITHKLIVEGEEVRYVEDIGSGEYRLLYRCRPEAGPSHRQPSPETVRWAQAVLESAADRDLLVLDELGPLELYSGGGWDNALRLLERRADRLTLVVVADGLLGRFHAEVAHREMSLVELSTDTREESLVAMLAWLPSYSRGVRPGAIAA